MDWDSQALTQQAHNKHLHFSYRLSCKDTLVLDKMWIKETGFTSVTWIELVTDRDSHVY